MDRRKTYIHTYIHTKWMIPRAVTAKTCRLKNQKYKLSKTLKKTWIYFQFVMILNKTIHNIFSIF